MIIEKLNQVALDKIITREDLHKIITADQYAAEIIARSDALLAKTKAECEQLRVQTVEEVTQKITSDNAKLLEEFDLKLESFLKTISSDIYSIVYKILQKLGIELTTQAQIYQLINNELLQKSIIKEVTISVNAEVLEELQQEFINHGSKLQVSFQIDNRLARDECVCATNLWTLKLNLATIIKHLASLNQIHT